VTPRWHDSDAAAQYVAGTLDPGALDAFEEHLLTCEECRNEVRLGSAIRAAAPPVSVPGSLSPATDARRWRRALIPLAAAAAIAITFALRESRSDRLGAVDAFPFVAAPVRANPDPSAVLVDSGMAAYSAGDFSRAAELLTRATASDSSPGVQFYLGVSRLVSRDDAAAVAALVRATGPAGNPFADDARYYAMKALVRMRRADSALALYRAALPGIAAHARARAFADSIGFR
jgi:tetratricopeptide (TPR) repeat protein